MRGVYTARIDIASLSAAKTVLLLESPVGACFEILSANITNRSKDSNEMLEGGLFFVTTEGTPSGTAVTPEKHELGDQASGISVLGNLSAEPTSYNTEPIDKQGFSNLAGYRYDPIPEERPLIGPSKLVGLRLLAAPDTAFAATCQVVFREIG